MEKNLSGKDVVVEIKKWIESNYFNQISLGELAEQYFINLNYLCELFLRETGKNFRTYVTDVRLKKAEQYLIFTDFTIDRISDLIGYKERGYFTRVFKNSYGVSPGHFRRKNLEKAAENAEKYVYIAVFRDDPLILDQDIYGLEYFAKQCNVHAMIEAPAEYDSELSVHILENVIKRHPAGIMVCAPDDLFIPYINDAVEKGIPTITVDCDIPGSKRLATVSSNWKEIGRIMATEAVKAINYRGKVALLDMRSMSSPNMKDAFNAFSAIATQHKEVQLLGEFDDHGNAAWAKQITNELLDEHPDIAALLGFDSKSAIGICQVLKERNLKGKVKVFSVDMTTNHIALLREGYINLLIGQKRSLFTYYGGRILYDINHSNLEIAKGIAYNKFLNVPDFIDTGLIVIDRDNLEKYLQR